MSRSGYSDGDCDDNESMLRMYGWQANVRRCIAGRKGQSLLWELYQALEASQPGDRDRRAHGYQHRVGLLSRCIGGASKDGNSARVLHHGRTG